MSTLANRLDQLSPEKRKLVLQKLAEQKKSVPSTSHSNGHIIKPVSRDRAIPLSFSQQRLWFLNQLEQEKTAYNEFQALRVFGALHIQALEKSITELIRRHESLRTVFPMNNGAPEQKVMPPYPYSLPVISLRNESGPERELFRLAQIEQEYSFDLSEGPLLRFALLQLGDTSFVLLISLHHIIADGWSLGLITKELSALYEAFAVNAPSPFEDLPVQYADFTVWQRQQYQGDVKSKLLDYWKQQLTGIPGLMKLPYDRPRPPVQTFNGRTLHFDLDPQTTASVKRLGKQHGSTMFMTFLGIYAVMLHRHGCGNDIVIGSPIANRTQQEIESVIGFFVNSLVYRIDLSKTCLLKNWSNYYNPNATLATAQFFK
jgi:hypothetical protein